ncbi:MAG: hypothetical protein R3B06_16175 [Kofleriaceae bacterium]
MDVPSPAEFLAALGLDPCEAYPDDCRWAYRIIDGAGAAVVLSFDVFQRSVQTVAPATTVVCEGMTRLWLDGTTVRGEGRWRGAQLTLTITTAPALDVRWATLVDG